MTESNLTFTFLKEIESSALASQAAAAAAAAAAESLQSCPTLCDLIDSSPSGSSAPGILCASGKEHAWQCRRRKRYAFNPWIGKIPWRRAWHPTAVVLPGESPGQRSLVGCRPWGCKDLDTTEWPPLPQPSNSTRAHCSCHYCCFSPLLLPLLFPPSPSSSPPSPHYYIRLQERKAGRAVRLFCLANKNSLYVSNIGPVKL